METNFEKNYFNELVKDYGQIEYVPFWAFGYLMNGDSSDLSEEEIAEVDSWRKDMYNSGVRILMVLHTNGSEYTDNAGDPLAMKFRNSPVFGKAADCVEFVIVTRDFGERLSLYHSRTIPTR